jgi:hypothetical protein
MSLYEIEEHIGAMIPETDLPTEEVVNQRKAAAVSWLEANALKTKPAKAPRNASASAEKGNRKSSSHSKAAKSGEKPKEEKQPRHNKTGRPERKPSVDQNNRSSNKAAAEQKYVQNTQNKKDRFAQKASDSNKEISRNQEQAHSRVEGQHKQNTGKAHFDRRDYAARKNTGVNAQAPQTSAAQAPAPKKSFLKKLLNSILGK